MALCLGPSYSAVIDRRYSRSQGLAPPDPANP
jgi:hypothetical protein